MKLQGTEADGGLKLKKGREAVRGSIASQQHMIAPEP